MGNRLSNIKPVEILELTAARFRLPAGAMSGPVGHSSPASYARGITAFLVRKHTPATLDDIGSLFGLTDRSLTRRIIERGESWSAGAEPISILSELVELDIDRMHTERMLPAKLFDQEAAA